MGEAGKGYAVTMDSPGVAHDQDAHLVVHRLQLLQRGDDKDGCLTHTALGLAHHVHAEDCLRDALVLNCGETREHVTVNAGQKRLRKMDESCPSSTHLR